MKSNFKNHGGRVIPRSRREAFSLIEIMVAVTILAFIIVGLLAMFYHVQRAFRAGVTNSDVMEGGRAILSLVTRDLQEASAINDPVAPNLIIQPSLGITGAWGEVPVQQTLPSGKNRVNFLQDVTFFTQFNGDWTAVGYRVLYGENGVGTLYRSSISTNYESNPLISSNKLHQLSMNFLAQRPLDNTFHRILDGIVHFNVTAYDTNGLFYTNATFANGWFGFTNQLMPSYLDIELGVLEPNTVEKYRANLEVSPTAAQNFLKRQIGRTHLFRQRVTIRPAANQSALN